MFLSFVGHFALAEHGLAVRADVRQRRRHRDHDDRRLLYLLVETAGQAIAKGADAEGRLNQAGPVYFASLLRGLVITNLPCDE